MKNFNGLGMHLGNLSRLSDAESRSISPENPTGKKGGGARAAEGSASHASRELGLGWKVNPYVMINPGEIFTMAEIEGPGAIQHIWLTGSFQKWRFMILRIYWDGQARPSVECPLGDFFGIGWERPARVSSPPVCVNPKSAANCYWEMPFRKSCRMTVENISSENASLYYQVDHTLTDVPDDTAYFHAQFRRSNPLPYKEAHTILDGVEGRGHYVGTSMFWGVNNNGWWGEGEIKFYIDGDDRFPTICGTGTEDYFCGSYDFEACDGKREYQEFSTPHSGMPLVIRPDGLYVSQTRFSLYRWHVMDPVRFKKDMKATIQALGWRSDGRYLPLRDDISSVAYWYQTLPTAEFPALPGKDFLEVI